MNNMNNWMKIYINLNESIFIHNHMNIHMKWTFKKHSEHFYEHSYKIYMKNQVNISMNIQMNIHMKIYMNIFYGHLGELHLYEHIVNYSCNHLCEYFFMDI